MARFIKYAWALLSLALLAGGFYVWFDFVAGVAVGGAWLYWYVIRTENA